MTLFRFAQIPVAVGLLVALSSCETPAPPAPVAYVPPPILIAMPPPPIAMSTRLIELASTYRATVASAAQINPNFTNGDDVSSAVRASASYEQVQLQEGAVAYAAIAALQEPNFVASVRRFAADRGTREDIAARLLANPAYVTSMPNVELAAGLAINAINGTGQQVESTGVAVKQSAYSVQRQAWSKVTVPNAAERLDLAKSLSAQRAFAGEADVDALRLATSGQAALSLSGAPVSPPYTPVITRGLAVAALAALGMAGDDRDELTLPLLHEDSAAFCLNMAKLNLYQCLAVSGPYYEDIFCMGQHAIIDTGQCLTAMAGAPAAQLSQAGIATE